MKINSTNFRKPLWRQNHDSLVAMEPMVSFNADEIRNKKVDVLPAVRPIHPDAAHQCAVRGQYGQGWVGGKKMSGYREEDGASPDSQTETFVALRLFLDNWRWQERADKNIDELLEDLNGTFHRLRQSGIDGEVFDVISGFEALSVEEK